MEVEVNQCFLVSQLPVWSRGGGVRWIRGFGHDDTHAAPAFFELLLHDDNFAVIIRKFFSPFHRLLAAVPLEGRCETILCIENTFAPTDKIAIFTLPNSKADIDV